MPAETDIKLKVLALPETPTSPLVIAFAERIERVLQLQRHHTRPQLWRGLNPSGLVKRCRDEVHNLQKAIADATGADNIADQAALVAALALIIQDACADQLKPMAQTIELGL